MIKNLDLILSLFENPLEAIDRIIIEKPVWLSLVIFFLANLCLAVSGSVMSDNSESGFLLRFILFTPINLVMLIISAAVFHLTAELLKGRGSATSLFVLLNFSLAPILLNIPVALLSGIIGRSISGLAVFLIFVWCAAIAVVSIKKIYSFSTARAVITALSPAIYLFILFAGTGILFLGLIAVFLV